MLRFKKNHWNCALINFLQTYFRSDVENIITVSFHFISWETARFYEEGKKNNKNATPKRLRIQGREWGAELRRGASASSAKKKAARAKVLHKVPLEDVSFPGRGCLSIQARPSFGKVHFELNCLTGFKEIKFPEENHRGMVSDKDFSVAVIFSQPIDCWRMYCIKNSENLTFFDLFTRKNCGFPSTWKGACGR